MISQITKKIIRTNMESTFKKYGITGTLSVYKDSLLVLKIKKSNSNIDFLKNYNSNVPVHKKQSIFLTVEYFNRHFFSGDAKNCVNELYNIASQNLATNQQFVIEYH